MKWFREHADVWTCGPFSICREYCHRRTQELFELYDNTRFVGSFNSLVDAKQHAEHMGYSRMEIAS